MTSTEVHTDRLHWGLLGAALLQTIAPAVQSVLDVSQPADGSDDLLITPAGWTFSIWGLIYLLAIVHAVVSIVRNDGVGDRRFVIDLIVLYVGAAAWIAASATGSSALTMVVLLVMAWFAIDAARRASAAGPSEPGWTRTLARATSGIYAGWASAAMFLNVGTAAIDLGVGDADSHLWQVALLAAAAAFALVLNATVLHSPWFAGAVAWALVGIIAAVSGVSTAALVVAVAGLVLIVAEAAIRVVRGTH